MTTVSPPKPWERGGSAAAISAAASSDPSSNPLSTTMALDSSSTAAPGLPDRPNTLSSSVNQNASNYSPCGQSRLGAGTYGSPYGGMSSYSSPYSRMGGMGSMYGGGGYGSMYGGIGGMGGMHGGGYGGGYGMNGQPGDQTSLTNSFNQSTQATFQIIESIVGAFGGFAQMLESTYMATHSSFFAMVSVAEQFGNLRNTLGSVLGIFTLLRWMRTLMAKLTGRPPPADATSLTPANFSAFVNGVRGGAPAAPAALPDGSPAPPRPSKKPFIMFIVAVFGLPYLMGKLIRALARSQEAEEERRQKEAAANGTIALQGGHQEPIDPRKLDFGRLRYDYTPSTQSAGIDLAVKKGDFVAVLSKTDPMGNPSEWWRCRGRDGQVGYLPSPYMEVIPRKPLGQITNGTMSQPGSRTMTLKGSMMPDGARTKSLNSVGMSVTPQQGAEVKGKPSDISAESFQKSAFYY